MWKRAEGTQTRVKTGNLKNLAAGLLLLCSWPVAALKPATDPSAAPQMRIEVRGQAVEASHPQIPGGNVGTQTQSQRQIVDPCLGTRWQLIADSQHPERPGRMVLLTSGVYRVSNPSHDGSTLPPAPVPTALPVIRAGDRITVLQQTSILRARLQAVALESAATGQTLRVRLLGGTDTLTGNRGTVVDVRAVQAGEAEWPAADRNPQ